MARLFALLFVLNVALVALALISCLSADSDEVRALPKVAWVFIILLFAPIGPIAWFLAGRPQHAEARSNGWRPTIGGAAAAPAPRRPVAPDDDPEFLASLAKRRQDDEDLFQRWEQDLRRREEDLRQRDREPGQRDREPGQQERGPGQRGEEPGREQSEDQPPEG